MDARVTYVILPIAKKLIAAADAAKASGEGYLAGTLLHEISHGLGPAFARKDGKQVEYVKLLDPRFPDLRKPRRM